MLGMTEAFRALGLSVRAYAASAVPRLRRHGDAAPAQQSGTDEPLDVGTNLG